MCLQWKNVTPIISSILASKSNKHKNLNLINSLNLTINLQKIQERESNLLNSIREIQSAKFRNCRKNNMHMLRCFSHVWFFVTPWTVAHQALLSMGFSRQGYWSGLPFPSPGELPDPGIEPRSPALRAGALPSEPPGKPHYLLLYPPIF